MATFLPSGHRLDVLLKRARAEGEHEERLRLTQLDEGDVAAEIDGETVTNFPQLASRGGDPTSL